MSPHITLFILSIFTIFNNSLCAPHPLGDALPDRVCHADDPHAEVRGYTVQLKDNLSAINFINSLPILRFSKPEMIGISNSSFSAYLTDVSINTLRCNPAVETVKTAYWTRPNDLAWYIIELKGDVPAPDFVSSIPTLRAIRDSIVYIDRLNFNAKLRAYRVRELESNPAVNVISPVLFIG